MKAIFPAKNKSRTDKRPSEKPDLLTLGERCVCVCVSPNVWSSLHGHWFGSGLDYFLDRNQWSTGTHHATTLSKLTGHGIRADKSRGVRRGERRRRRRSVFRVQLCERICVGLCQGMAELSGMRCLPHSLAVGVSIMRVTEGCLCVGECFSAFCVCICIVACAQGSASLKCAIINSVCRYSVVTKGGYSGYSPCGRRRTSQSLQASQKYTVTRNYVHTQRADSDAAQTLACVDTVYLMKYEYYVYLWIVQSVRQGGGRQLSTRKIVCACYV